MKDPLFILSPPRSFSTLVSAILGQHPEIYALPELQMFGFGTIGEVHMHNVSRPLSSPRLATAGLLRTIAEIHEGIQTEESTARAWWWLIKRWDWSPKEMMTYISKKLETHIVVEKTPLNSEKRRTLAEIVEEFPRARYLHLTRCVNANAKSLREFMDEYLGAKSRLREEGYTKGKVALAYPALVWYQYHRNILEVKQYIKSANYIRVKGEDILAQPRQILRGLCEWLEVDSSERCIDMMLRPHESPYAYIGPRLAEGGGDAKFARGPVLRLKEVSDWTSYTQDIDRSTIEFDAEHFFGSYMNGGLTVKGRECVREWREGMAREIETMHYLLGYRP